jgi:hypothetical protein
MKLVHTNNVCNQPTPSTLIYSDFEVRGILQPAYAMLHPNEDNVERMSSSQIRSQVVGEECIRHSQLLQTRSDEISGSFLVE